MAVAYGNWEVSQYYQSISDFPKALDYGDKALASAPHSLDILVSQTSIAQQMKNNAKMFDYAVRGGEVYNSIGKSAKPEGMSDQDFANHVEESKSSAKSSYEFLEAAAYNVIAEEKDPRTRMADIERFTPAFPNSRFDESVTSYAMMSLAELKDSARVISYGEKVLATNPNSLPTLLLLAGAYVDDPKPGSVGKAVTYSQKAITVAKADAPDADRTRKLSAGVAHSTLGYAYMKQDKTAAAIPELKSAAGLAQRTGRSAVRDCALPPGICLRQTQPGERSPRHPDGSRKNSQPGATALAGSAGQSECGSRQGQIDRIASGVAGRAIILDSPSSRPSFSPARHSSRDCHSVAIVILSGGAASRSEAAAQSKDLGRQGPVRGTISSTAKTRWRQGSFDSARSFASE